MREMLRKLGEAKGEVPPDLQAAAELQDVLTQFDIALTKVWARFEGAGPEMRKAFSGVQGSISAMKAATSVLQRERRGFAPAALGGGNGTAANDADLRKRMKAANPHWRDTVMKLRAKGEYLYAGEVPQDITRVDMVYVPKAVKAAYAGEYGSARDGTDSETGQASREFHLIGKGDAVRIWVRADGKITWD